MKISRQYSGQDSIGFWKMVNCIKNVDDRNFCYEQACELQNTEITILNILEGYLNKEEKE